MRVSEIGTSGGTLAVVGITGKVLGDCRVAFGSSQCPPSVTTGFSREKMTANVDVQEGTKKGPEARPLALSMDKSVRQSGAAALKESAGQPRRLQEESPLALNSDL